MSRFWSYFHDSLNWLPIFRPGPVSAILKGLAHVLDLSREDILWLRKQWNPVTCEEDRIVPFGESRGVPKTRIDTDESYKKRVINAYIWHKLGGKVRGVERIYAENDFVATILNASNPELWAHFRVLFDVNDTVFDQAAAQLSWFLANEYKPARSKIEYFITAVDVLLDIHVGVGVSGDLGVRNHIYFEPPENPEMASRTGLAISGVTSFRCKLYFDNGTQECGHYTHIAVNGLTSARM